MHYSICSRFRGTFLGTAVGKVISTRAAYTQQNASAALQSNISCNEDFGERLTVLIAKTLIQSGKFDTDNWRASVFNEDIYLTLPISSSKAIIATLPIILFYHESEIKLRQNLTQFSALSQDAELAAGVLAIGYAIAQSLHRKLNARTLIPQILQFINEPQLQITQQLATVQTLVAQTATLEKAVTVLQPQSAIALAFYCFLSSIQDLRLAVMRAAKINHQPQISMITGALSGAYHGTAGIPVSWHLALAQRTLSAWDMTSTDEMLYLSDSLLAVWSGMLLPPTAEQIVPVTAIAAPKIIRPR